MEMVIAHKGCNSYITFMDDCNNPAIFMADNVYIDYRNKLRKITLEQEPSYVINRPLGEMYKLIEIFKNRNP